VNLDGDVQDCSGHDASSVIVSCSITPSRLAVSSCD